MQSGKEIQSIEKGAYKYAWWEFKDFNEHSEVRSRARQIILAYGRVKSNCSDKVHSNLQIIACFVFLTALRFCYRSICFVFYTIIKGVASDIGSAIKRQYRYLSNTNCLRKKLLDPGTLCLFCHDKHNARDCVITKCCGHVYGEKCLRPLLIVSLMHDILMIRFTIFNPCRTAIGAPCAR